MFSSPALERRRVNIAAAQDNRDPFAGKLGTQFQRSSERSRACAFGYVMCVEQQEADGLRRGRVLVLFPEGERSIDGPPKVFKKGAAILSLHLQVPIVPVAIEGFYDVWPRGKRLPQKFHTLRVSFGDPIYPPQKKEPSEADYAQLTALLRERVLEMWQRLVGKQPAKNFQVAAAN